MKKLATILVSSSIFLTGCATKIQGTKYSDGSIRWDYESDKEYTNKIPVERIEGKHKPPIGVRITTGAGYLLMPINLMKDGYSFLKGDFETEATKGPRECLEKGYCELNLDEDKIKTLED